jgi:1,4-alpha-glucan branching enzyme
MEKGFLCIILHAHLPFVRHPEYPSFFEENWFFEAITECYLPLLSVLDRLYKDRIDYRLTLSLSPTLITMMSDKLLLSRYQNHLQKQLELADKEITRNRNNPAIQKLARLYRRLFQNSLDSFLNHYQYDLISAFKKHQHAGNLELITTAATHGFLPLLNSNDAAVRNQIKVGIDTFERALDCQPSGFWLPECGFYPGLESILADAGVRYFFTDSHGLTHASEYPYHGVHAPVDCGNGVAAFARDPETSRQVWSAQEGYPGDYNYREYYRDIGFDLDLDLDYLGPYILDGSTRINTGIKYHRITGSDDAKEIYQPRLAWQKAQQHAHDFIEKCQHRINQLNNDMNRRPIIVAPYDAELLGHWWFEGPQWLEQVLRLANQQDNGIKTSTCSDYLNAYPENQIAMPSASTWGNQGYSEHWINDSNHWIYPHLHQASAKMTKLAADFKAVTPHSLPERTLNQANRSLLLAQASDWPFIMKTGTTTE